MSASMSAQAVRLAARVNGLTPDRRLRAQSATRPTQARAFLKVSNVSAPKKRANERPDVNARPALNEKPALPNKKVNAPAQVKRYPMSKTVDEPVKYIAPIEQFDAAEPACQEIGSVTTTETLEKMLTKMEKAQAAFSQYSQEQVDEIFKKVAMEASTHRMEIAAWAHEDTGMGVFEDKVIKNHFASEFIYNKYKNTKTVGPIWSDHQSGLTKVAEPVGIIMGVAPVTNPTATVIFKALIALKTRNCIIFSPHPRARHANAKLCKLLAEAAVKAGAPKNVIGWIDEPTLELSSLVAHHKSVAMILATGGPGMVHAAYSSGKPAIGVGSGNTPAVFHESADIRSAVHSVTMSKTFDNGMICASEQVLVAEAGMMTEILKEFANQGSYILNKEEAEKVANVIFTPSKTTPGAYQMTPDSVGQSAHKLAKLAGFEVPLHTTLLIAETNKVGPGSPFTYEKLCPVLGAIKCKDYAEVLDMGEAVLRNGGMGHTSSLFCAEDRMDVISMFNSRMPAGRVLVDMPSAYGAIGDIYNFHLAPSLTLGCGSKGGNSVSENVGPLHLLDVKNIVEKRENMLWFKVPQSIYFKNGILGEALKDLADAGCERIQIISDWPMTDLGYTEMISDICHGLKMNVNVFSDVTPDPTLTCIRKGVDAMNNFHPDCIIALGGGSPMDAAKIMRLMYEHPDQDFSGLYARFMDIRKRIVSFPKAGTKIKKLVCIPTTSGTGAEVTPFAVITDDTNPAALRKYPIADYALTPEMAIIDPQLASSMPRGLTASTGLDALTHALESYVSVFCTDYTAGLSLQASKLIFENLPTAFNEPASVPARSNLHNASTLAGMAFANAFLGVCHSMAHQLGHMYHVPHGLANAILMSHVVRFNAAEKPSKRTAFPQYDHYKAAQQYARLARFCELPGVSLTDDRQSVEALIAAIEKLKSELGVPASLKEWGVDEADFLQKVDLLARMAYDDQCTGANPRHPMVYEIKQMLLDAYYGEVGYGTKK